MDRSTMTAIRLAALTALVACRAGAPLVPQETGAGFARSATGATAAFLYVGGGNGEGVLSQYVLGVSTPLHTITQGGNIAQAALDRAGRIIAIHAVYGITAYNARTLGVLRTSDATYPSSVAIDRKNNVYVANCGGAVEVLYPGADKRAGWIKARYGACSVGVNRDGDVYVVDGNRIEIYKPQEKPGSVKLLRTIDKGLQGPGGMAFDRMGYLYVLNYTGGGGSGGRNYVAVYPPNASTPSEKLTNGIDIPTALVVSSHDTLYVANRQSSWRGRDGWISLYGSNEQQPIARIKAGINNPTALAIDRGDNLYVANLYANDVTVYARGGSTPIRHIRNGVEDPNALTVGN